MRTGFAGRAFELEPRQFLIHGHSGVSPRMGASPGVGEASGFHVEIFSGKSREALRAVLGFADCVNRASWVSAGAVDADRQNACRPMSAGAGLGEVQGAPGQPAGMALSEVCLIWKSVPSVPGLVPSMFPILTYWIPCVPSVPNFLSQPLWT